ncbi:MAG: hypothetical protein H0T42_01545 [Deltaproteobacteria bacterium]|nr:hypothetical protein [Deltaproteobacteria bacterium]
MKKLALAFASVALLATPVFACDHADKAEAATPKTADKTKKEAPKADKAKEAPAKDATAKPAEKTTEKKADKVSSR